MLLCNLPDSELLRIRGNPAPKKQGRSFISGRGKRVGSWGKRRQREEARPPKNLSVVRKLSRKIVDSTSTMGRRVAEEVDALKRPQGRRLIAREGRSLQERLQVASQLIREEAGRR